jgi:protein-S-isoprenylcysteine O-methyltransferase Ste14
MPQWMSVFIVVLAVPAAAVAIYSIATGKAPPLPWLRGRRPSMTARYQRFNAAGSLAVALSLCSVAIPDGLVHPLVRGAVGVALAVLGLALMIWFWPPRADPRRAS